MISWLRGQFLERFENGKLSGVGGGGGGEGMGRRPFLNPFLQCGCEPLSWAVKTVQERGIGRQTGRQTDRQEGRQRDRQRYRQTDRPTDRNTGWQTDRLVDLLSYWSPLRPTFVTDIIIFSDNLKHFLVKPQLKLRLWLVKKNSKQTWLWYMTNLIHPSQHSLEHLRNVYLY